MEINDKSGISAYRAADTRYQDMPFRRSGKSGVRLPALSLGLWHNFGQVDPAFNARLMLRTCLDQGIVHWDLANNYGPPFGSAEETFGQLYRQDFRPYRDELFLASKAGFDMWPGPYGNFGSRKYLIASLDQSLKRMGVDYVDVFYHHRPDPDTPLEETMGALDQIVRQGKALYAGISNYPAELAAEAARILRELGTPCLIHQVKYSMFERAPEEALLNTLDANGIGCITFSPLAQGMLTNKYVHGIPKDSRAAKAMTYLGMGEVEARLPAIQALHRIAERRGQTLAQMAIVWLLKDPRVTSVLIGASSPGQILENIAALEKMAFSPEELAEIEAVLT
ncbi:MAG: aldo/keto reductase [Bacteroidia bacterium]|nr:aldo/keto reductase [Bacteroidia bacterium]